MLELSSRPSIAEFVGVGISKRAKLDPDLLGINLSEQIVLEGDL